MDKLKTDAYYILGNCPYELDAVTDKIADILVTIEDKVNELVDHANQQPATTPDSEARLLDSLDQATRAELDTLISDISKVLTITACQASDPRVYAAAARHRMSPNLTTQCRHDHIESTVDAVSDLIHMFFHSLFYRQDTD
jgi:Mg2+ and Co2+ transporter CorA